MQDDFNAMIDALALRGALRLVHDSPAADATASHSDSGEHSDPPMAIAANT